MQDHFFKIKITSKLFAFSFFFSILCQVFIVFLHTMTNYFEITSHWADTNPILLEKTAQFVQKEIQLERESKRYRRLIYYFFEKEITSDITKKVNTTSFEEYF